MLTRILVVAVLLLNPISAHAQASFMFGFGAGLLFGGSDSNSGQRGAAILYSADEDTLKKVDPMTVRLIADEHCFDDTASAMRPSYSGGMTLIDLFEKTLSGTTDENEKDKTVLQIVRIFDGSSCADIWFAYVEQ